MEEKLKEVVHMETKYWEYVHENKLDDYLNLWHDDFLGWPSGVEQPIEKEKMHLVIDKIEEYNQNLNWDYKIENMNVNPLDGNVVAIYSITASMQMTMDTKTEKSLRITHIWKKENKNWKIISGMDTGFID